RRQSKWQHAVASLPRDRSQRSAQIDSGSMRMKHLSTSAHAHGFSLLDVLISVLILAFGMLSLARMIAHSALSEVEASQRLQAMTLAQDMVERINLNRKNAAAYVGDYTGTWTADG